MTFQEITEIIAAGLGSIGFSMMFQLRGKKLILIGCGGALSWFIFLLGKNSGSSLNGLLWAVIVAAAIAEIEARRRKTPVIVLEVPLLVPLFISAFRRANDLAMAMEARCYRGGEGRTKMKPLQYKKRDYLAYGMLVLYLILIVAEKLVLE